MPRWCFLQEFSVCRALQLIRRRLKKEWTFDQPRRPLSTGLIVKQIDVATLPSLLNRGQAQQWLQGADITMTALLRSRYNDYELHFLALDIPGKIVALLLPRLMRRHCVPFATFYDVRFSQSSVSLENAGRTKKLPYPIPGSFCVLYVGDINPRWSMFLAPHALRELLPKPDTIHGLTRIIRCTFVNHVHLLFYVGGLQR